WQAQLAARAAELDAAHAATAEERRLLQSEWQRFAEAQAKASQAPMASDPASSGDAPPGGGQTCAGEASEARSADASCGQEGQDEGPDRQILNSLRQVANRSARTTLTRVFWKRFWKAMALRVVLTVLCFCLGGALVFAHGLPGNSYRILAWSGLALGMIS